MGDMAVIIADLTKWIWSNWVVAWWALCSPIHRLRLGDAELRMLEAMAMKDARYIRGISPIDGMVMRARLIRCKYIIWSANTTGILLARTREEIEEEAFWNQNHPTEAGMKRLQKWHKAKES